MQIKVQRHAYYLGMNSFAAISGLIWFQPIAECFGAIEQLTEMKTELNGIECPELKPQLILRGLLAGANLGWFIQSSLFIQTSFLNPLPTFP